MYDTATMCAWVYLFICIYITESRTAVSESGRKVRWAWFLSLRVWTNVRLNWKLIPTVEFSDKQQSLCSCRDLCFFKVLFHFIQLFLMHSLYLDINSPNLIVNMKLTFKETFNFIFLVHKFREVRWVRRNHKCAGWQLLRKHSEGKMGSFYLWQIL